MLTKLTCLRASSGVPSVTPCRWSVRGSAHLAVLLLVSSLARIRATLETPFPGVASPFGAEPGARLP